MTKEIAPQSSRFATRILYAMIAGIIIGITADIIGSKIAYDSALYNTGAFFGNILHIVGQLFITSMKMLVVPLILFSLITGVSSVASFAALGRIGIKTIVLYVLTTIVAILLAIFFGSLFQIGMGASHALEKPEMVNIEPPSILATILDMVPSNPIAAMANGEMLQIIVFAILVGIALTLMGKEAKRLKTLFSELNDLTMRLVLIIMKFTPYGVFALLVETFSRVGYTIVGPLLKYVLVTIGVLAIQFFVTNGALFVGLTKLNFWHLLKKMRPALVIAFSTASSNATIPTTLAIVEKKIGVSNKVASFSIPFGATVHMDGTAIMQGMATLFIANAYQIDLGLSSYLMIIVAVLLASIGAAGAPGTGIIMLTMVLHQSGLPVEGIGLIIGIDRIIEMVRTMVNIFGDAVVATIVAKSEGELNLKVFKGNA